MTSYRRLLSAAVAGFWFSCAAAITGHAEPNPTPLEPDIRLSVFDWHGGYGGVLFSLQSFEAKSPNFTGTTRMIDGDGRLAGIVAGYNFVAGRWLYGIEADAGYGQMRAVRGSDRVKADVMATFRVRAGHIFDRDLVFATAGLSLAGVNQKSAIMTSGNTSSHLGLVVGGGIEHAITSSLTGRLEYLYGHSLEDGGTAIKDLHMIRAGAVYHFAK